MFVERSERLDNSRPTLSPTFPSSLIRSWWRRGTVVVQEGPRCQKCMEGLGPSDPGNLCGCGHGGVLRGSGYPVGELLSLEVWSTRHGGVRVSRRDGRFSGVLTESSREKSPRTQGRGTL